jgi:hypothetical protein
VRIKLPRGHWTDNLTPERALLLPFQRDDGTFGSVERALELTKILSDFRDAPSHQHRRPAWSGTKLQSPPKIEGLRRQPRTHCVNGHELVGANLANLPSDRPNYRRCRICLQAMRRDYKRRRMALLKASTA